MTARIRYACTLLAVLIGVSAGPASAFIFVGDPFEGNSWSQRFVADTGTYNFMRIDRASGTVFEMGTGGVMRNFSVGGWGQVWESPDHAAASGPSTTGVANPVQGLQFDLTWVAPAAVGSSFYFHAYSETGVIVDNAKATWNGGGWTFAAADWHPEAPRENPIGDVPEPATVALMAVVLVGAGVGAARRCR